MRFSSVKIEKLFGYPAVYEPNQYYLIEFKDITRLYLSDSRGSLHLLNDTPSVVNKLPSNGILNFGDTGIVIADTEAIGYREVTLPPAENRLYFEFWVLYGNGLRIKTADTSTLIKISGTEDNGLESNYPTSTVRLYAENGHWVARYITGQWNSVDLLPPPVPVIYDVDDITDSEFTIYWYDVNDTVVPTVGSLTGTEQDDESILWEFDAGSD